MKLFEVHTPPYVRKILIELTKLVPWKFVFSPHYIEDKRWGTYMAVDPATKDKPRDQQQKVVLIYIFDGDDIHMHVDLEDKNLLAKIVDRFGKPSLTSGGGPMSAHKAWFFTDRNVGRLFEETDWKRKLLVHLTKVNLPGPLKHMSTNTYAAIGQSEIDQYAPDFSITFGHKGSEIVAHIVTQRSKKLADEVNQVLRDNGWKFDRHFADKDLQEWYFTVYPGIFDTFEAVEPANLEKIHRKIVMMLTKVAPSKLELHRFKNGEPYYYAEDPDPKSLSKLGTRFHFKYWPQTDWINGIGKTLGSDIKTELRKNGIIYNDKSPSENEFAIWLNLK